MKIKENLINNKKSEMILSKFNLIEKIEQKGECNKESFIKLPNSKMKLYAFMGIINKVFFDTEEELNEYIRFKENDFGRAAIIDYLGAMAGRQDVVRVEYPNGETKFITAIDLDGYAIYNKEKSVQEQKPVWEFEYGDIREIYIAFKDRGISFANDLYKKEEELFYYIDECIKQTMNNQNDKQLRFQPKNKKAEQ